MTKSHNRPERNLKDQTDMDYWSSSAEAPKIIVFQKDGPVKIVLYDHRGTPLVKDHRIGFKKV